MNKHTRKKYPHARREITVWVDPESKKPEATRMGLFDETVAKLAEAEADLAEARKHITNLEKALDNSRKLNMMHIRRLFSETPEARINPDKPYGTRGAIGDLNALSKDDEEQLFQMHENESWIDPDATPEPPPRPTIGARIRDVAALFRKRTA